MKLSKELCEAVINLRESRWWKTFLEAVAEDKATEIQRSLMLAGPQCHRAQGSAIKLQEILKFIDDAPANFEKLKNAQPKP